MYFLAQNVNFIRVTVDRKNGYNRQKANIFSVRGAGQLIIIENLCAFNSKGALRW